MKTIWDFSPEHEAKRLTHTAHQIAVGFYRANHFTVLPYGHPQTSFYTVLFPDLAYQKILRFWEKAKKTNVRKFPINPNSNFLKEVKTLLQTASMGVPKYEKTKEKWEIIQEKVLAEIVNIFPNFKNQIEKIIIHPTKFGTTVSFSLGVGKKSAVEMYLREDANTYEIVEAILTHLTRNIVYSKYDGLWQESELLVDFLIGETNLTKIIKEVESEKYIPTTKIVRTKQSAKLLKESEEFLKKLGLPRELQLKA